jgi:hypothetical protein
MVNVDNVYQKVLALANKEQRGYITPQEFNLLADKAQMEIFESYFHSLKDSNYKPKNNVNYADNSEMIMENLHDFEDTITTTDGSGGSTPSGRIDISSAANQLGIYRIKNIQRVGSDGLSREVDEVNEKELLYILNNPLLSPTINRSIYVRSKIQSLSAIQVYPIPTVETVFTTKYWTRPIPPKWDYVVVQDQALWNSSLSTHFSLNPSEEENLVTKILELSGIIIQKPGLVEVAMTQDSRTKQQQIN